MRITGAVTFILCVLALCSCGGGGGGSTSGGSTSGGSTSGGGTSGGGSSGDGSSGGGSPPSQNNEPPTVSLSTAPSTIASGQASSISWSTTHADSCTASGGWMGSKPTSGSASTGPLTSTTTFTLSCMGIGGSANGSATVSVATPTATSMFPLHVEAGKRYLIDAQGKPFFVHGDAAWSIMVQLTRDQVDQYLEDRQQKGFNTLLVELIEHHFADNPPNNVYGDGPFETPGDFSTPNEAYFSNAEYVISKAGERGFLVLLAPAFMGFEGGDEGWYQEMVQNGASKLRGYGQYVANRFKAYANVLWVEGGDFNPPDTDLVNAVANGIRDVNTPWLQTFQGGRGTAALQFFGTAPSWLTVNDIYTDENTVVSAALQEYARSETPFFLIEALYEGEGATAQVVRAQAYQATLSGAVGQVMGNNPVWKFSSGWQSALNSDGAVTLTHFRDLVGSLAWWSLQPDTDGTLLTDGVGSDATRAAAAVASDGSFALIYTPEVRDLSVNLARLSGPNVRARWYDPTSGNYQTASDLLPADGSHVLRPNSANAAGDADWVLVLDSQP